MFLLRNPVPVFFRVGLCYEKHQMMPGFVSFMNWLRSSYPIGTHGLPVEAICVMLPEVTSRFCHFFAM